MNKVYILLQTNSTDIPELPADTDQRRIMSEAWLLTLLGKILFQIVLHLREVT